MTDLKSEIPVLYFHSVAPYKCQSWIRKYLTLELSYFEGFLKYLKKNGWQTIFLDEYYFLKQKNNKTPSKICCITFDDGFMDNYIYVYPLLKKYGFCGTIFVNPEFVDTKRSISKNLEDVWHGHASMDEINQWGYLSWEEMKLMQNSGIVDIQSHTLTHTKYFVSDELISFHHPGADSLYPIGNIFPERKPYYINDSSFEKLIPFGTPFFKESSSVIAKKVFINNEFNRNIVELLKDHNWKNENAQSEAFQKISGFYNSWRDENRIIQNIESQYEYESRLQNEIINSKKIIEKQLDKKVEFLCWPHGDNSEELHQLALDAGYLATTTGSKQKMIHSPNRISIRTSIGVVNNSIFLTNLKTRFRMSVSSGSSKMRLVQKIYQKFR